MIRVSLASNLNWMIEQVLEAVVLKLQNMGSGKYVDVQYCKHLEWTHSFAINYWYEVATLKSRLFCITL